MFTPTNRIAVLLHDGLRANPGKTGLALIRYRPEQIAVVIDQMSSGENFAQLTGIDVEVPIVASMADALIYQPDWLAIGIAPSGGSLPDAWFEDVRVAVESGVSIANGLHTQMAELPQLQTMRQPGQIIWDIRQEPLGLHIGTGAARQLRAKRVLAVGTDMNVGKMSACLELYRSAQAQGLRAKFLGTGQAGIMIAGGGIPLDAVRVDFAAGAVEQLVIQAGDDVDLLFVEGQGSLLHPGSTATLPLIRGGQPTHLILVHRAGQTTVRHLPHVPIPPLAQVVQLYEAVAQAGGAFAPVKVVGIALNTGHLDPVAADQAIAAVNAETGLPCTDVVRYGGDLLIGALT
ncbi:DUF1611 domain-containing protein [filamentous cyanobacterium LEGE 11480]|uniref:DUF1611 domain-containing protein n=1 Tax=Romeriopsis navalis LEGE 11480 TaxID=2777977 RepID=A0A928VTD7_9CYAN|nr:DUF1611 domain-containing protein [Romeriopsis navalis]MBE9032696.1 DUF1611 domain-containing protein [Romeriopsis navalis LEGE 11480]